jgi:hypothetical protein
MGGPGKSPNIGLTVRVVSCHGEHSQHGIIWRCKGEGVKQLHDSGSYIVTGWADFAASWLRRIEPDALDSSISRDKEVTA